MLECAQTIKGTRMEIMGNYVIYVFGYDKMSIEVLYHAIFHLYILYGSSEARK